MQQNHSLIVCPYFMKAVLHTFQKHSIRNQRFDDISTEGAALNNCKGISGRKLLTKWPFTYHLSEQTLLFSFESYCYLDYFSNFFYAL